MQISSQNSIHVWLEIENNCFESQLFLCMHISQDKDAIDLAISYVPFRGCPEDAKKSCGRGQFWYSLACQYVPSDLLRTVLMLIRNGRADSGMLNKSNIGQCA